MKRVHLLAGGAALAPLVAGMAAVPATAAPAAAGGAHAKAVSMHPVQVRVRPDSCTGGTEFHIGTTPNGHLRGHGWETRYGPGSVCIGTVDFSVYFTKTFSKSAGIHIKSTGGLLYGNGVDLHGTAGHWVASTDGIHRVFHPDVIMSVCVWSQYGASNCTGV